MRPRLRKLRVVRHARLGPSRGSWVCVDEDGPCWAPFEPRHRPRAGKSGDPRSQNADNGVPREVPVTQAMATKGARRAPARAVSSFPLWCKGGKRRREHQAKAPVSVQRDQDQSNGRKEVIVEPKPTSPPEPLAGEHQL